MCVCVTPALRNFRSKSHEFLLLCIFQNIYDDVSSYTFYFQTHALQNYMCKIFTFRNLSKYRELYNCIFLTLKHKLMYIHIDLIIFSMKSIYIYTIIDIFMIYGRTLHRYSL